MLQQNTQPAVVMSTAELGEVDPQHRMELDVVGSCTVLPMGPVEEPHAHDPQPQGVGRPGLQTILEGLPGTGVEIRGYQRQPP